MRDKNFIISSIVILVLLLGGLGLQVALSSGGKTTTIGTVGDPRVRGGPGGQGEALGVDVDVRELDDEAAARAAVKDGDVDGALHQPAGDQPRTAGRAGPAARPRPSPRARCAGWRSTSSSPRLASPAETFAVEATRSPRRRPRCRPAIVAAIWVIVLLDGLLILFGQFVAQGVVEEKSSRVVELPLATRKPWQLLAGKIARARFPGRSPRSS